VKGRLVGTTKCLYRYFGVWPSLADLGYRGVSKGDAIVGQRRFLGKQVHYFSSSHERSHLLCAFGMSNLAKGTPCYALIWEGSIGAFYEIDSLSSVALYTSIRITRASTLSVIHGCPPVDVIHRNQWANLTNRLQEACAVSGRGVEFVAEICP